MDIFAIIKENLPDGVEIGDKAIKAIAKEISTQQGAEFIPKEWHSKKSDEWDKQRQELEKENKELKGTSIDSENYKQKWESEIEAHKQTKTAIETEKALNITTSALHRQLAADGANPKLIKLLEKEFDLATLEVEGEAGAEMIKGWDKLPKASEVKKQYADVFGKVETTGANVANPPPGKETKPATNKDMNAFIRGTIN